ncbi:NADAR family protein [Nocardia camponoti]|uniref:NADAR domain-containing protein n=1 Tax=Nocardia camponoti TaxID=1616106 RepID=A0A917V553_9NOCA|nr:NADAR family protein [Nocardia camponoti]GGK38825.1 hypothetical protein GCM10011591_08180 [Nocardia camponoti]
MRIESVSDLCATITSGVTPKYLPFWGHTPRPDGTLGASCLSQWWPARFQLDGVEFATAEHYMMWRKALLFNDEQTAAEVVAAGHPSVAKKLGRKIANFDEDRWVAARFDIVAEGNAAKFGQDPALADYLRKTGERVLVEASPVDRIWGNGLAADDPRTESPSQWLGLNLLGFALMRARAELA